MSESGLNSLSAAVPRKFKPSPHSEDAEVCISVFHFTSKPKKVEEQSAENILLRWKGITSSAHGSTLSSTEF